MVKKPKIVSVLVGDDSASLLYTKLKKQAAERVGIEFEVVKLEIKNNQSSIIKQTIEKYGADESVTGVMVQLPLPGVSRKVTEEIVRAIPLDKDVDGLRWEESGVMLATVRAIMSILDEIANRKSSEHSLSQGSELWAKKFVVLGARGAVGRPLVHFLRERGVEVIEVEWDSSNPAELIRQGEVVISCVGKAGLVTGEMVGEGVVAIDVGMSSIATVPQLHSDTVSQRVVGDMTQEVYEKASVAVPVPKGVGPVTIACLLENAVELYGKSENHR